MKHLRLYIPPDEPLFHRSTYAFQVELWVNDEGTDVETTLLDHPHYHHPPAATSYSLFSPTTQRTKEGSHAFLVSLKLEMAINPTPFVLTFGMERLYKHDPAHLELFSLPPSVRGKLDTLICDYSARIKTMSALGRYTDDYIAFSSGTNPSTGEEFVDFCHRGLLDCIEPAPPPIAVPMSFPAASVQAARTLLRSKCQKLPLLDLHAVNIALFWNENECKAEELAHWMKQCEHSHLVVTFMLELDILTLDTVQLIASS